ncbi:MAG: slipin family protein [Candidatus Dormibacteraeota bacterium]|nr:slipin family protein [Candidatus Dormibacteraeota bacterium]
MWLVVVVLVVLAVLLLVMSVRIVNEYERGVVFRLGRLLEPKGPGLFLIIPLGIDRLTKIDLRTLTLEVPPKEVITRDNVTIKVIAVIFFRVIDPRLAVTQVLNYVNATSQIAQTTLRSVLGESTLDELLAQRGNVNEKLQRIIDGHTEPWGVKVSTVEVKDVELPQTMQRAMAKEAESEREKRAKVIHAQGEFEASRQLAAAAEVIGHEPAVLQLRYLQTLTEIGVEKNTTVVFPLPIDIIEDLMEVRAAKHRDHSPAPKREDPPPAPKLVKPPDES